MQTVGFSKKVAAAVFAACGAQVIALVVQVLATGEFDSTEWAQVVGVGLTAAFGVIFGYAAPPNEVTVNAIPAGSVEMPPDAE